MQIFAALILMILIILLVLLLLRPKLLEKSIPIPKRILPPKIAGAKKTTLLPDLIIQQLSVDESGSATVVESFPVCISAIPAEGYRISGPGGSGSAVLSDATRDACSVSHPHAALGYDEQGFFLKDLQSANGTFALEGDVITRIHGSVNISENMLLRLGHQWLRFSFGDAAPIPGISNRQEPATRSFSPGADHYTCPISEPAGYVKKFKR